MGRPPAAPYFYALAQVRLFGGVDVVFGELPAAADTKFLVDVAEVSFHCLDGHCCIERSAHLSWSHLPAQKPAAGLR